jgi:hypothetical protein
LDTSPSRPNGEKTDESGVVDAKHNQSTIKHVGRPFLSLACFSREARHLGMLIYVLGIVRFDTCTKTRQTFRQDAMYCVADLCIVPMGVNGSVAEHVAAAIRGVFPSQPADRKRG